ncbi:MAG: thioredoxin domain-containing protein [Alphaproteobacteria bacterium]|nr:thioredoxin domain-containing protein [Alphaproteobacteria bacterium]
MNETRHIIIICGHCGRPNRLPAERAAADARCGACHQPVFTGHPIEVDEAGFNRHSGGETATLTDIWAPWCAPCRGMAPAFERAAIRLEPRVRLLKLNSDTEPGLSGRLGITAIPTLLLMRAGTEIARHSGAMDTEGIVRWTEAKLLPSNHMKL